MPVNETLATYSDYAFHSAVAIYLLAMVLHLGEYARTRVMVAVRTARVPVSVPAGADDTASPEPPAETERPEGRPWPERFGRMGVALTVLGALLHVVSIVLRGVSADRWPWGNMYEFISAICLMAVVGWLVMLRKTPSLRPVGIWVLLPVEILLFLAGTSLYVRAAPVMPALQSYWLVIHVTAISISSGLLIVSGVASMLFLVRRYGTDGRFTSVLPTADALDRIAYRICVFSFPLYTFAIMCGAIWAEAAWGRYWGWDPKETVAFVVWVVYACYLHARSTAGWRTGWAAWINVLGFAAVLFNLFFVNLVTTGLHSYAGLG
ncbi:c-type cytochrome biogenesis protein CcsB [Pseudonocardia spinosispora]|uniref:c-type cytochrome biogenesis protein CcsB n=1 Tax=Pseudonocardia spinosispora TaxID=103441 RepID=UPI00042426F3|nr:c-type cytochrome biogenesis protein CcsB [Pseudonocardia spinosispora]